MRRARRAFSVPVLVALSLVRVSASGVAKAETRPLPLDLTWDVPAGCPESSSVVRRIEQILHGPPSSTTLVIAKAKIRSVAADRFELALTMRTADVEETRTIDAASCFALAEASAVVIALAIDPSRDVAPGAPVAPVAPGAPVAPEPAPPPVAAPAASSPRSPPRESPPREPPPVAPRSRFLAVGAGGALDMGTLPHVAAGITASGAVRLGRFRAGVSTTLWLRQRPTFDEPARAGASFDMVEVGAFGGYLVPFGSFAVGPCANLEATFVRVEGFGIRTPRASWSSWPTVVLGGRGEARLTPWLGLFARADLLFAVDAPTFTLGEGQGASLHEPAPVAARFSLGTEIIFP